MTRTLRRRLAAVEQVLDAGDCEWSKIATTAMDYLWGDKKEALLGAIGALREGREPNVEELEAKREYEENLARECRIAGLASTKGLDDALDVKAIMIAIVATSLSSEALELCERGIEAQESGRSPSQQESEAVHLVRTEWSRLARLAGTTTQALKDMTDRKKKTRTIPALKLRRPLGLPGWSRSRRLDASALVAW